MLRAEHLLDRDLAAEVAIEGAHDPAHAAARDQLADLEPRGIQRGQRRSERRRADQREARVALRDVIVERDPLGIGQLRETREQQANVVAVEHLARIVAELGSRSMRVIAVVAMVAGLVRVASAEDTVEPELQPDKVIELKTMPYPERFIDRPLVLPTKMLAIHGVLRINLTAESAGSPIWVAPSAFYGLLPKLQVGIVHDPGLCLLGKRDFLGVEVDECRGGVYDDFAVDGLYQLLDRPDKHVAVAGHATIGASQFDPMFMYLRAGALARYTFASRFAVIADWALRLGLSSRDEGNKEAFDLPVQLAIQPTEKLVAFFELGLLAPLSELTDSYFLSMGIAGLYAINATLDVGARFEFPRLTGGHATGTSAGSDFRQLDLFVTYRR